MRGMEWRLRRSARAAAVLVPTGLVAAILIAISTAGLSQTRPAMVVAAVDTADPERGEGDGPPPTTLPPLTTAPDRTTAPTSTVSPASTPAPLVSTATSTSTSTSASASASASTPTTAPPPLLPSTTERPGDTARARGEDALSLVSYDWEQRLPGWTISFHPRRDGVLGYTFVHEKRIEIYVRAEQSASLLAHVVAHELGHAVDVTLNDSADRQRWQEARGITDRPWWPGSGVTDFSTGAGDFAESFAAWQVGDGSFRSRLGGAPDRAGLELMKSLAEG